MSNVRPGMMARVVLNVANAGRIVYVVGPDPSSGRPGAESLYNVGCVGRQVSFTNVSGELAWICEGIDGPLSLAYEGAVLPMPVRPFVDEHLRPLTDLPVGPVRVPEEVKAP